MKDLLGSHVNVVGAAQRRSDGGVEIPVGLGLITLLLFALALVNLFTKKTATIWGFGFTVAIFTVWSESVNCLLLVVS